MSAQIDPRLRALFEKKPSTDIAQAVFTLSDGTDNLLPPGTVALLVDEAIEYAERTSASKALRIKVFHNLHSMSIEAPIGFLSALITHPHIQSGMLNTAYKGI